MQGSESLDLSATYYQHLHQSSMIEWERQCIPSRCVYKRDGQSNTLQALESHRSGEEEEEADDGFDHLQKD